MNPIYLSRVVLNDFRTFGDFTLDIPAAPGLTLLVGTNGLGKSSFFDGVEWCLTGEVRRFASHVGRLKEEQYLTRRDAKKGAHKVSLHFDQAKPLVRSSTAEPSTETLIELLKSPDWNNIGDLKAYLAFTHFLGQAAQQRFTSRRHDEQWQALKGPSGIDRLEEIRLALRGTPTTNAFRKRTEGEQLQLDQAEKALISWREASERLERLRNANELIGVVPETTLASRAEALRRDFASRMERPLVLPDGSLGTRLVVLRQEIQAASEQTNGETAALEPLRTVAENYLALVPESDPDGAQLAAAKAVVADATVAVTTAELALLEAERFAAAQTAEKAAIDAENDRLAVLRQLFGERARLTTDRAAIRAEQTEIATALTSSQAAQAAASARLNAAREAQVRRSTLQAQLVALRELVARAQNLSALAENYNMRQTAAAIARQPANDANARIAPLRARLASLEAQITESNQALAALRIKASDIADALARLAGHIEQHDESCPLCFSAFAPGVLQKLSSTAAAAQDADLAIHSRRHQELVDQHGVLTAEIAVAEQAIATHSTEVAAEAAALANLNRARGEVAASLGSTADADLIAVADSRLQTVVEELSPLLATDASGLPTVASGEADVSALDAELSALRSRQNDADRRALATDNGIRTIDERLNGLPQPLPPAADIERLIEAQRQVFIAAQSRETLSTTQLSGAHAGEAAARQRLIAAQNAFDAIESRIAAARRGIEVATAQWKAGGLTAPPAHDKIQERANALAHRSADITTMLDRHSQIALGLEGLQKQEELQALMTAMEIDAGADADADPTVHERKLHDQVAAARKALQLTQATQEAVKAYSEKLKGEADQFSSKFLEPLNDMVENFNRALLSTPGETVEFNAEHAVNRTQLDMQLRYADDIDNEIYNRQLPPQLVLSEGQMAANGFSILCAASTAYPWSNWRALLLDDPLQHNDVIHAAAFVDLMRNLVEMQSYQLLMSTHDRAEGEFLARKFDAANLPCTIISLTAPSKEGVLADAPRYNEAARAIMRGRLEQTA